MIEPAGAKRILYVITKASWGGAQRYVFELAGAAKARGHEVAVAYGTEGHLVERLTEAGIRTLQVPSLARDIDARSDWESLRALVALLKEERPDVVHVNSSKGGLAILAARIVRVPRIIFTAHGWAFNEARPWWQKLLLRGAYAATLLLSHATICVSEAVRRDMSWLPGARLRVVKNAIGAPAFRSRDEARDALVLGMKDAVWLGMIAELHPSKRVEDAIDALAELSVSHPEALLVVIGEGEMRPALEERVRHYGMSDRVRLVGFKPDAAAHLPAFDIFFMPSRTEALGLALLEAGHAGLPVVAARVGGIPEVVRHKETGLLVPAENPHALSRALRRLIEHPEEAHTYAAKLKERVGEAFSKERMLEETFRVYDLEAAPRNGGSLRAEELLPGLRARDASGVPGERDDDAERDELREDVGTAGAHEGDGGAGDREEPQVDARVDEHVRKEEKRDADDEKGIKVRRRAARKRKQLEDKKPVEEQD